MKSCSIDDKNSLYSRYFDDLNAQYQMNLQTKLQLEQLMLERGKTWAEHAETKAGRLLLSLMKYHFSHNKQLKQQISMRKKLQ